MSNDPSLDELRAYAAQMGLLGNQPTVVDPSLDRFAQSQDPLQQYAQAHLTMNAAVPGLTDTSMFGPGGAAPPAPMGAGAPAPIPSGTMSTMGPSWGPNTPPPGGSLTADSGIPDVGPITITRGAADPHNRGFSAPGAAASHADAVTDSSPLAANAPPPAAVAGGPGAGPGAPMAPPVMFGGGGMFVPPRQMDVLDPLGKTPGNRLEFDKAQADEIRRTAEGGQAQADALQGAIQDSAGRSGLAEGQYLQRKAMYEADLRAAQDHAAAMQNANDWAQSAAAAAAKEASDAKVDQGHFFASRGAGQQIALIIGAGLGALGASLTNTPNYSMQMIQGAMADDMKAQEANLANKRASSDSALKRALNATGDMDSAKALVRIQQNQIAQDQIAHYDKIGLDEQQRAHLAALSDKLLNDSQIQTDALKMKRAVLNSSMRPVVGGGFVGGQGIDPETIKGAIRVPDGKGGWRNYTTTNMAGDREPLAVQAANLAVLRDLGDQVRAITDKGRLGRALDPQDQAQLDSLTAQIVMRVKGPKDNSDADAIRLDKMKGNTDAWMSDGSMVLDRFIANQSNVLEKDLTVRGAEPIQRGYTTDRTGTVHAAGKLTGQSPDAGTMPKPIK